MAIYQSIPQSVEAVQWTGDNGMELRGRYGDKVATFYGPDGPALQLMAGKDGAQEWVPVPVGHWIVCQPGDHSDIWPVDPEYFAAKYHQP